MSRPLIIAHRGDPSRALENSRAAVRLALSLPADMIEIDIRMSRDQVLYVMHDDRTGRTCEEDINIERSHSGDIAAVRLRNGETVPTLQDILELVRGRAVLNLEIKSTGAGGPAARQVLRSRYDGEIVISSFREREVLDARAVMPEVLSGKIFDSFSPRSLSTYRAKGHRLISLRRRTVTKRLVEACREKGIRVFVWTVDDEREMRKLLRWGVDGIYSNIPILLRKVIMDEYT